MTEEQHAHLNKVRDNFVVRLEQKYTKGQQEHGGNLWEKEGLLDMAIDEAVDQVVYLMTLKDQMAKMEEDAWKYNQIKI